MNFVLFDDPIILTDLLPFTYTRPVGAIRIGILTISDKWAKSVGEPVSFSLVNPFNVNDSVCYKAMTRSLTCDEKIGTRY